MKLNTRVALIDDDNYVVKNTEEYLKKAGFDVWSAQSAEEFYRRYISDPVDIVILDLCLPGEDGLSVAQLLKNVPGVIVIIVSARGSDEERLAGLRSGADRYLVKPISMAELVANIEVVINRKIPLPSVRLYQDTQKGKEPNSDVVSNNSWRLFAEDWLLYSPNGKFTKLTAREYQLLKILILSHGKNVSKNALITEIFGTRDLLGAEHLVALIARLRKKSTRELMYELPIKTAHMIGYTFSSYAILHERVGSAT